MDIVIKEKYMTRCFDLAKRSWRSTNINPVVGAVLVYEGRIIGEGYHQKFGEAHAEVNCLQSVSENDQKYIEKSDLFISLEPCSFIGKTPACSSLIIEKNIPRVHISCKDPNPKVSGNGISALKEHGIEVYEGILEEKGQVLLRKFKVNILQKRPFIGLKWAQSKLGYSGLEDQSVWYTNALSKVQAHNIRAQFEAILVGTNTIKLDNPKLNNRLAPGINPTRIIIDLKEEIDKSSEVFKGDQNTIVITRKENYFLPNNNLHSNFILDNDLIDWQLLMSKLYDLGISSVLIEGGPSTHKSLINEGLWDEAHILSSKHPQNHGLRAPTLVGNRLLSVSLDEDRYDHILP